MKALSIRQPWATLIMQGAPIFKSVDNPDGTQRVQLAGVYLKDIENRNWRTDFRGRIVIHASGKRDNFDSCFSYLTGLGISPMAIMLLFSKRYAPTGCLLGEVDIVNCVTKSKSQWFTGEYGFVLANPMKYDNPIPYKGKLGLFDVELGV